MDEKFVCPCGLICCDCLAYKPEIYQAAKEFQNLIKANNFDEFLSHCSNEKSWEPMSTHLGLTEQDEISNMFSPFKKMTFFMEILDGIINFQCKTTCKEGGGCSMGNKTRECIALKCIKSKNLNGCWECNEFIDCGKLDFLKKGYGSVIEENLVTIKEKGVESVKSRGNKYYSWQRKSNE